jgi:hypothetical protein
VRLRPGIPIARPAPSALAAALAIAIGWALVTPPAGLAAGGELRATRTLVTRLAAAGRGEAAVTVTVSDLMGGADHVKRGRLALEPPDRARLDFPASGERLAVRHDGGEWVQPEARQLVQLSAEQAGLAAWLWEVFMSGGSKAFAERTTGERRFVLEPREAGSGLPDRVTVELDTRGLPATIGFEESGGGVYRYRFSGWRFRRARGAAAFRLTTPAGYHRVPLP